MSNFSITRKFGIRMDGCGGPLEDILNRHLSCYLASQTYTAIEIGSAGCTTLKAFRDIISDIRGQSPWKVIGFDLPVGKAWSLDMEEIKSNKVDCIIEKPFDIEPLVNKMSLVLADDPRLYIQEKLFRSVDFAFIDGCHGKCSGLDFLAVEKKISPGGIVVFHDYGEIEQGTDYQTHCREFINVRTYVHRLGLAEPRNEPRKGWRFVGEIPGSRRRGGDGNSCAVVQRTIEELEDQPNLSIN